MEHWEKLRAKITKRTENREESKTYLILTAIDLLAILHKSLDRALFLYTRFD